MTFDELSNDKVYPNGTVGNKGHVSIFLENKSEESLHISEVISMRVICIRKEVKEMFEHTPYYL